MVFEGPALAFGVLRLMGKDWLDVLPAPTPWTNK